MNDATRATLRAVFAVHAPTDRELRDLASTLQVPYVELWALAGEMVDRPTLKAADVQEWLAWREPQSTTTRARDPQEATKESKRMACVGQCRKRWGYTDVHAPARGAPATGPVTIRAADAGASGFAIPPPPPTPELSRPAVVRLDWARIETTLAETATISALLANVFTDDEPAQPPSSAGTDRARAIVGLDGAHWALARALAQRRTWRRADVEALARGLGLLPDGALETLNEVACERCGAPLCNGEDPIAVSARVAQELVA